MVPSTLSALINGKFIFIYGAWTVTAWAKNINQYTFCEVYVGLGRERGTGQSVFTDNVSVEYAINPQDH